MYLLDTHILLWWLNDDAMLTESSRELMADPKNTIFVSSATAWEISIKKALGKIRLPGNLLEAVLSNGFEPLSITLDHAEIAGSLPPHHADPFDRMLIAQAKIEKLTLLSHDRLFERYDIDLRLC